MEAQAATQARARSAWSGQRREGGHPGSGHRGLGLRLRDCAHWDTNAQFWNAGRDRGDETGRCAAETG